MIHGANNGAPDGEWHEAATGVLSQNGTSGALQYITDFEIKDIGIEITWPYLVVAVSPVVDEQYQWAVVSSSKMEMMFILARDPGAFNEEHKEVVLAIVENLGFTELYNSPLETYQGEECMYDAAPEGDVDSLRKSINMDKLRTLLDKLK